MNSEKINTKQLIHVVADLFFLMYYSNQYSVWQRRYIVPLYTCINVHFHERENYIPPKIESITKEYDTHSGSNDYWQWLKDWYIHRPLQVQAPCVNNTVEGWTKESLIGEWKLDIINNLFCHLVLSMFCSSYRVYNSNQCYIRL